jgi:EAL domain-containing protein (putative c-di-GMP-specific phosphodiesterase class I)/GGDEF domain-containing protein
MNSLRLYKWLSKFQFVNYRAKIMILAFIGTHIPLIALVGYFAFQSAHDLETFVTIFGIALVATLVGTAVTLYVLNELLQPVVATSSALRTYRETRLQTPLPTNYQDEVGRLMADAVFTMAYLETVRDALEHVDAATSLPNHKRLCHALDMHIAKGEAFVVCVLHFANFARIVGALSMQDALVALKTIADRLDGALHVNALLARVGRADLAICFPSSESAPQIGRTLAVLVDLCCADEIIVGGLTIQPELYCGVSMYPADGHSAAVLLDHAIAAAAMAGPTLAVAFHSAEERAAAVTQIKMEEELRRALDQNEFCLHYQPVIDLAAGRVVGAEALIRWQHPELGLLPPGRFIPTAEATGLIDPIGLWVLQEACAQIRRWNAQGLTGLKVAINLSARQFLDPDLSRYVSEALGQSGIERGQLEIELTETAAMADYAHSGRTFAQLRDLGVSIAIDDFGTGYASMSYLRKLPFDQLKIDREFVSDVHQRPDSQAICRAMVALSTGLGLDVLAEGAEAEDEVRFLHDLGCQLFQGYFFSKPLPVAEFVAAINGAPLQSLIARFTQDGGRLRLAGSA